MEHLFLIGALTYLVVSWLYILALKAKVRDCMTYIQNRIDKANPECEGLNHRPQAGKGLRDTGAPSQLSLEDEPRRERERWTENPNSSSAAQIVSSRSNISVRIACGHFIWQATSRRRKLWPNCSTTSRNTSSENIQAPPPIRICRRGKAAVQAVYKRRLSKSAFRTSARLRGAK